MSELRIDSSGFYLSLSRVTKNVIDKIKNNESVYAKVNERNPIVKRAKSNGRNIKGECVKVTKHLTESNEVWLPRTWFEDFPEFIRFRQQIHDYRKQRIEQTRVIFPDVTNYTLKQSQIDVLSEVFSYPGITSGCLALHTGFGKTVLALHLIKHFGVRCLWLSHTNQLLTQLQERAQSFLNVHVDDLFENPDSNAPIITCTIQSLLRRDLPQQTLDSFGLLIIDEVHHMSAPSFSQAFHKIGGIPITIGLSATLERKDGLESVFQYAIGKILSVRILQVTTVPKVLVVQNCWNIDITLNRAGDPLFAQAITDLSRLPEYNDVILRTIRDIFEEEPQRRLLVLTDRKEHILLLDSLLHSNTTFDVGAIHGNVKDADIHNVLHANPPKQIILATYGLASEGFDCPGLNAVMMATPRNDIRQSVGRILGERVTSVQPLIIDIRNTMGLFYNQGRERIKYYKDSGFDVNIKKCTSTSDDITMEIEQEDNVVIEETTTTNEMGFVATNEMGFVAKKSRRK
jgi:superfamily II DNA or RNA helicase